MLGDSRRPETNQFDMVRAFVFLAGLPALPFRSTDRIDIVPVDFVADAIAKLHQKEKPEHEIYHLSSGVGSETFVQLTDALAKAQGKRGPVFVPEPRSALIEDGECTCGPRRQNRRSCDTVESISAVSRVEHGVRQLARVAEMGRKPAPFSEYCFPLLRYSRETHFVYKYRDWPIRLRHQPPITCRRMPVHDGFHSRSLGERADRAEQIRVDAGRGTPWKPGTKLKLLFAGYNGTRNTGSDVRVEEMMRQVRRILGEKISISV